MRTVTDATFADEVLDQDLPVLVDFWAQWCGPCKRMAPMLEEVAQELEGEVVITKLDIDANRETATAYGVMSLPSMKVFLRGEVVHTIVGAVTRSELLEHLSSWRAPEAPAQA